MHRRIKRQAGMSGNMPQGHVHRLIVAFDRKDLITFEMQVFITLIEHFGQVTDK